MRTVGLDAKVRRRRPLNQEGGFITERLHRWVQLITPALNEALSPQLLQHPPNRLGALLLRGQAGVDSHATAAAAAAAALEDFRELQQPLRKAAEG